MAETKENQKLLEVKDLHVSFFTPAGEVKALNEDISDSDNKIRSKLNIVQNHRRENQYKANKNISNAMLNILDWFERYPDIVKNINQA